MWHVMTFSVNFGDKSPTLNLLGGVSLTTGLVFNLNVTFLSFGTHSYSPSPVRLIKLPVSSSINEIEYKIILW